MPDLHVTSTVDIDVDHATVRRQFGDVAHHAATHVHRGVVFEVITDDGARCHYRQTSKVGPISLSQEMELDRVDDGPLVNRIVKGQFTGGSLSFTVVPAGDDRSTVTAELRAPVSGPMRLLVPMLRSQVTKQLKAALAEDKDDLESGRYTADPPVA